MSGSRARTCVMESRSATGEGDVRRQRRTVERTKVLRLYRAATELVVRGTRLHRGVYRVDPAVWLRLCDAIDDAHDYIDPHPGDSEAAGAIAGMREAYA